MGQGPRWHEFDKELPGEGDLVIIKSDGGGNNGHLVEWTNGTAKIFTTTSVWRWYGPIPSPDAAPDAAPTVEKKFEMVPCSHCFGAAWVGDTPCISCDNKGYTLVEKAPSTAEALGVTSVKEVFRQLNVPPFPHEKDNYRYTPPHDVNGFIPCPVCKDWVVKRGGPDSDYVKCTACGDTGWARGPAIRDCLLPPNHQTIWVTCPACHNSSDFPCPTCGGTGLVIGAATDSGVSPYVGVAAEDSK